MYIHLKIKILQELELMNFNDPTTKRIDFMNKSLDLSILKSTEYNEKSHCNYNLINTERSNLNLPSNHENLNSSSIYFPKDLNFSLHKEFKQKSSKNLNIDLDNSLNNDLYSERDFSLKNYFKKKNFNLKLQKENNFSCFKSKFECEEEIKKLRNFENLSENSTFIFETKEKIKKLKILLDLTLERLKQRKKLEVLDLKYVYENGLILMEKLNHQHKSIIYGILDKTLHKINFQKIPFIDLFSISIVKFKKNKNGTIYYYFQIHDKITNYIWKFKSRFSTLRELHLEMEGFCQVIYFFF